ncbi:MAG: hypothetical protein CMK09_18325 [Ponticaulis sp.]|nr:hypothetical protein [Ponticaulis sp.]|tara:strand:- start:30759 stop:31370 length:612 start_codon:yes stop_codon:yes gene_type:complete
MKILKSVSCLFAMVVLGSPLAGADVVNASANGFQLSLERTSTREAKAQFDRVLRISEWWGDAHTHSGDASNLRVTTLAAGGQWRETWSDGAGGGGDVEHGRVIAGSKIGNVWMVRFDAGLGPLQEMGVKGVLTIEVEAGDTSGSKVRFKYNVTGADFQELDKIAPVVDGVLTEQLDNLVMASSPTNDPAKNLENLLNRQTPQN